MKKKRQAYKGRLNKAEKAVKRQEQDAKKFKKWLSNWRKNNPYKAGKTKDRNDKYKKDLASHFKKANYSPEFKRMFKP